MAQRQYHQWLFATDVWLRLSLLRLVGIAMPSWPMIEYQAETQRLMVRVAVALIDKTRSESRKRGFVFWYLGLASLPCKPARAKPAWATSAWARPAEAKSSLGQIQPRRKPALQTSTGQTSLGHASLGQTGRGQSQPCKPASLGHWARLAEAKASLATSPGQTSPGHVSLGQTGRGQSQPCKPA
jgi:hypothetical protein